MHLLYLEWNSYANNYIKEALISRGHKLITLQFPASDNCKNNPELCELLVKSIMQTKVNACFSINFFPIVAIACKACNIKYISWTYDSPYSFLYSDTIFFETNYAFVFDYEEVRSLTQLGVNTVYHLPMAVPQKGYSFISFSATRGYKSSYDITMIGSMYSEKKHRLIDRLSKVSPYTSGYIDGLMNMQTFLYGADIITNALSESVIDNINSVAPLLNPNDELQSKAWTYSRYFLCREITRRERFEALKRLSCEHNTFLFTHEETPELPNVKNYGSIDYLSEAPTVMHNSKINLNISLRSIQSGIPLRAFDILGSGGFLLTNYQEELMSIGKPDFDYVYFESPDDLSDKASFYLAHDDIRAKIAKSGQKKVYENHTYNHRIAEIERIADL